MSLLNVCLVLLTVVRSDIECSPRPITCHAGTYSLGEPAAVSCNLHANMSACKLSVFIVRYPPDAVTTDPGDEIVSCPWDKAKQDHQCHVEKGYEFNDKNGDHPILRIASLGNKSAGFYMCYVIPADNTTTHVCKLTSRVTPIRPRTTPTTTTSSADESSKNSPMLPVLLTLLVGMAGVSTFLLVVIFRNRRRIKRFADQNEPSGRYVPEQGSVSLLSPLFSPQNQHNSVPTVQKTTCHPDTKIESVMKNFRLGEVECGRLVQLFKRQLKERNTNESSTSFRSLVDRREPRECLVVLLGTSLKILLIKLEGTKFVTHRTQNYYPTPSTGAEEKVPLLQFIANSVNNFVNENKLSGQTFPLTFVCSCPWEHSHDHNQDHRNIRLTKPIQGLDCDNVVGENLTDLLQQYLKNNVTGRSFDIKVVVNDVVDIHRNAVHQNPSCNVAVVIGNGFNASFLQDKNKVKSVITTDCGSFGDNDRLDLYLNDFDRDLDNNSLNTGKHILEKMVGGTHLGELVRLVLVKLKQERLLFKSASDRSALFEMESFSAEFISLIESDTDDCCHNTQCVLRQLSLDSFSDEDCRTVRYVCMVISERAVYLAAAGVAAVVKHAKLRDVTVAADSSPYPSHPRFCQLMHEKTRELVGETVELAFKQSLNENGKGAALLAAAT